MQATKFIAYTDLPGFIQLLVKEHCCVKAKFFRFLLKSSLKQASLYCKAKKEFILALRNIKYNKIKKAFPDSYKFNIMKEIYFA